MSERELYLKLGRAVAERRRELGLSQAQVADRIGLTRASLANVENGRQRLMLHHLYRLATALDVPSILELTPERWDFEEASATPRFEGSKLTPKETDMLEQWLRTVAMPGPRGKKAR